MKNYKHPFLNQRNSKTRLLDECLTHNSLIVAFDFDNTIYDYHKKGDDYSEVINLLKECCKLGFTMILFTAELDEKNIDLKKQYCEELGLRVDFVNESPVMSGSKKPYYNILLDDRAGLLEAFDNLSFVVECIKTGDLSQKLAETVIGDVKIKSVDEYVNGYRIGVYDGKNNALIELQELNNNTDLPSNETLYKIFRLLFEADEKMRKSSSCYMNTYQYYANEITKKWNDEKSDKI